MTRIISYIIIITLMYNCSPRISRHGNIFSNDELKILKNSRLNNMISNLIEVVTDILLRTALLISLITLFRKSSMQSSFILLLILLIDPSNLAKYGRGFTNKLL